jgi:tight adherence protein C
VAAVVTRVGVLVVASLVGVTATGLVVTALGQPAPSLRKTLRHLDRLSDATPAWHHEQAVVPHSMRPPASVLRWFAEHPGALPTPAQLRLVGRSPEQHVTYLFAAWSIGLALPAAVVGGLQVGQVVGLGWYVPLGVGVVASVMTPAVVHTTTVEAARRCRVDMRHQLSAYLDVVAMLLAGNSGYEGALEHGATAGDGRLFLELRRAMRDASARGLSLTEALRRTGSELGIEELEHVAATASLSAAEGAPVAKTLAAKCTTLRGALATEQETEARLRTSRLTTPVVGMALIFMALVMYPALTFS